MNGIKKTSIALAAAALMVLAGGLPANAASISGFRSCSVNYMVKLASISTGYTMVDVNGWHESASLGTNVARNWYSDQRSGNWTVNASAVNSASGSCY